MRVRCICIYVYMICLNICAYEVCIYVKNLYRISYIYIYTAGQSQYTRTNTLESNIGHTSI